MDEDYKYTLKKFHLAIGDFIIQKNDISMYYDDKYVALEKGTLKPVFYTETVAEALDTAMLY